MNIWCIRQFIDQDMGISKWCMNMRYKYRIQIVTFEMGKIYGYGRWCVYGYNIQSYILYQML